MTSAPSNALRPTGLEEENFGYFSLPPMAPPASGRRWVLTEFEQRTAQAIEDATACSSIVARILAARGVKPANAASYLNPSLRDSLPDPYVMADMEKAAERIADAIMSDISVGVFGDYDVDGTSAAAILKSYFSDIGAPLEVYLPDRILEGYGPTLEAFLRLKEKGVKIIITVDCGAAAHDAISGAAREGLEVIVLDHHQMDGAPPKGATAVVNPNRPDDTSGLTDLSAAGVAFMTLVALNRILRQRDYFKDGGEPDIRRYLDLTALGLVCDVMPMTGLARVLTAQGLKVIDAGGNPGLRILGKRAGSKGAASVYDLGFLLGPRINAAGRIGHARLAFDLLTTDDREKRMSLAERLHVMNAERQEIERAVQADAVALIEHSKLDADAVIVVAGEGWHPGVIGIVAGRLKDMYDRPVIVIGLDGETGKGSGRSITGVDLGGAIRAAREQGLLIAGGGHAMAAGLTIDASAVGEFAQFLNEKFRADVDAALAVRTRTIDAVVSPTAVSGAFAEQVNLAGPFGPGNPEPVFVLANVRVDYVKIVGENHLSCILVSDTGETARAIAFRAVGETLGAIITGAGRIHVAGRIKADNWRGGDAGQFQIVDAAEAL